MIRIGAQLSGLERTLLSDIAASSAAVAQSSLRRAIAERLDAADADLPTFYAHRGLKTRLEAVTNTLAQVDAASTIAAEAQLTLDLIRSQIGKIRCELTANEALAATADPHVARQAAVDAALREIDRLARSEVQGRSLLDGSCDFRVAGQISSQVRDVQVESLGEPTSLAADKPAQLFYTGVDRRISADALITLTGDFGSATLDLTQGQSLASAAAEINAVTAATGIRATTDAQQLILESVLPGRQAAIAVTANFGTFDVAGGNGDGFAQGTDGARSQQPSVAGTVLKTATQASLAYRGAGGTITHNAALTIAGPSGNAAFTVASGESLADVAARLNAVSHKTGATAHAVGDELRLSTVRYGAKATLAVCVDQGTFPVAGDNGDAAAQGTDAVAVINGRQIADHQTANPFRVDGNRFYVEDAGNRFAIEFAPDFVGPFSTLTLSAETALKFQLSTAVGDVTTLGLPNATSARLGGLSGTLAALQTGGSCAGLAENVSRAIRIVDEATAELTLIEDQLDAFADGAVATSAAFLSGLKQSLEESIDDLEKIHQAEATLLADQNRQFSDKVLASLANLSRQRARIMQLIGRLPALD